MTGASPKICVYCRTDCSSVPHVVNRRGAYCCRSCVPAANVVSPRASDDIAISPPDLSGKTRAPCPKCGSTTTVGVPQCAVCGHAPPKDPGSPKLPRPKRHRKHQTLLCKECGYDLRGLKENACPECGTPYMDFHRRDEDQLVSEEVARTAYRHAIIVGLIGLFVGMMTPLALGRRKEALLFPVAWLLSSAVGYASTFASCLLWVGFSSSLPLMAVQVGAIHAAALATVSVVTTIMPLGVASLMLGGIVYVSLMSEMLDMDPFDARCVSVACLAIHWVLGLLLRFYGLI